MSISYELYTLVKGRWQLKSGFEAGSRERAVTEAQRLEKDPNVERVRVVMEQYNASTNSSRETKVYETVLPGDPDKNEGDAPQAREFVVDRSKDEVPKPKPASKKKPPPKKKAPPKKKVVPKQKQPIDWGLVRTMVAFCLAAVISSVAAIMTFKSLNKLHGSGAFVFQSEYTFWGLVGGVFILTFAVIFIPIVNKFKFGSRGSSAVDSGKSTVTPQGSLQQSPEAPLEPRVAKSSPDGESKKKIQEDAPKKKQEIVERTKDGPQHLKDASGWLHSCMDVGLKTIPDQMKNLDSFNRFGLTLFFAGSGDFVGTRYRCDQKQRSDMLTERMQLLGHDENTAFAFCANIDEYLMQPKYLKMYDLGRTAMKNFLNDQSADLKLEGALGDWNKSATTSAEENASDFVVVLFTDIVNSTAQTQEIGDEGAMDVVRAHNQIIREALTMYHGTEVKHMGDGIMAVFQSVPNSIHAAIHMQNGIESHCQTTPDRPFRCRIGINAGEPIREGQDYFGTPVQLAARVMSKAESDEIAVSHIVQTMYTGKDVSFENVGQFDLKGFEEPMVVYHVIYRPKQAAAA